MAVVIMLLVDSIGIGSGGVVVLVVMGGSILSGVSWSSWPWVADGMGAIVVINERWRGCHKGMEMVAMGPYRVAVVMVDARGWIRGGGWVLMQEEVPEGGCQHKRVEMVGGPTRENGGAMVCLGGGCNTK
ncbi:hypothetical protein SCLCIDRAFT_7475 [Scleroderma citrinum Foug A]|uniref:Uncharacterized protein n=1 Tax=Scleroderma citrinum Foug A TaxID=1036808 RepID=A0A0C3EGT2_9AGAM|nr:hypothetical protein SCLCIDRAFT_7475 [Scleroderma citrinum Foug A]